MKSHLLTFVLVLKLSLLYTQVEIRNFTQSPGIVAPHDNVTFTCEAISDIDAYWTINGDRYPVMDDREDPIVGILSQAKNVSRAPDHFLLLLAVQASVENNGTNVTCFVSRNLQETKKIIVAGPPSCPELQVNYSQNGIIVTWKEPFSHPGFSITHYTLQITNTTDSSQTWLLQMGLSRTYTDSVDILPISCHELVYTVTAFNSLGNTSSSLAVLPEIQWEVLYKVNGTPQLQVQFDVCCFQEVNYTVYLTDSAGEVTVLHRDNHMYVHSGLDSGTYTVTVEAESIAGITVSRRDIVIEQLHRASDCEQHENQMLNTTFIGAISGVAVLGLVLFFLFLTFCILYCKQKRLLKKQMARSTFTETVHPANIPQRPMSLRTKVAATNPIYEGVVYESPTGEPLRALLTSTPSTPSTPLDSPRYVFDSLPATAPAIPPPRKASVISNGFQPNITFPMSPEGVTILENPPHVPVLKTGEDEYTVMKPVSLKRVRAPKPSPLTIPSVSTPPE